VTASESQSSQTLHNAWRQTGFELFPKDDCLNYSWYFEASQQEEDNEDEGVIEIPTSVL
jgi:hypothetical protein